MAMGQTQTPEQTRGMDQGPVLPGPWRKAMGVHRCRRGWKGGSPGRGSSDANPTACQGARDGQPLRPAVRHLLRQAACQRSELRFPGTYLSLPCWNVRHRYCWFPRGGFERLEPDDGKLSCPVLRGACGRVTVLWAGNGPRLPGYSAHHRLWHPRWRCRRRRTLLHV